MAEPTPEECLHFYRKCSHGHEKFAGIGHLDSCDQKPFNGVDCKKARPARDHNPIDIRRCTECGSQSDCYDCQELERQRQEDLRNSRSGSEGRSGLRGGGGEEGGRKRGWWASFKDIFRSRGRKKR